MMRRISLTLLAATAMGVVACQGAQAADIAIRKAPSPPPLPPPVQDWSGIYVGVEGGGGWGHQNSTTVPFSLHPGVGEFGNNAICDFEGLGSRDCDPSTTPNGFISESALPHEFAEFEQGLAVGRRFGDVPLGSINSSGWLFGAFFGAQKQWGNWVLGLEADVDGGNIKGSTSGTASFASQDLGISSQNNEFLALKHTASLESKIDELASVRGKIGFAPQWSAWGGQWMVYGTGGMAFAHVKNSLTDTQSLLWNDGDFCGGPNCEAIVFSAANTFADSADQSMFGYTFGAGIDWKWQIDSGSALVFGVEYQYFNFPTQTFTLTGPSGLSLALDTKETINVVKGRISYLFSIH
jgi:outer membrane immunogenic protein